MFAEPDFITIDGRGGATGASPKLVRDATSVPTIYALYRARKYLDEAGAEIDLVITGGLRVSSDFAKAIAMGADAVAVASAALIAAAVSSTVSAEPENVLWESRLRIRNFAVD